MYDPPPEPASPLLRRLPPWLATGDVHEWTKTVAVVVAALWGMYTFIWKDILVPSWAPASLVIEVKPRQEGVGSRPGTGGQGPTRLRLRVIATNPSSRTLYLLPSVWWASLAEKNAQQGAPLSFEAKANQVLRQRSTLQADRGQPDESYQVLSTGMLFIDNQILPGEIVSRDLSITLPKENTKIVLQLIVPALTRNPQPTAGSTMLFAGRHLTWAYSETDNVYAELCNTTESKGNESSCIPVSIEQEMRPFDTKSVVFSKTVIIND